MKHDYAKSESEKEVLQQWLQPAGKTIVDIGCGIGDLVRWLATQGADVTGVDIPELIVQAMAFPKAGDEKYLEGMAQQMPFPDNYADAVLFMSSLHHVPEGHFNDAIKECARVLKPEGIAIFIEPSLEKGCYYELSSLLHDELLIQRRAYNVLKKAPDYGLVPVAENFFYMERSLNHFVKTINIYVQDPVYRESLVRQAEAIVQKAEKEGWIHKLFKSTARVNVFTK